MTNFDDIPDDLLKEILSRLVCNSIELVFQCKCVSKRWLHAISSPDFISRCVRIQRDDLRQTPDSLATLVVFNYIKLGNDLLLSSQNPFLTSRKRNFSLNFLPCHKDLEKYQELAKSKAWHIPLHPHDLVPPTVMGTYKDLVLCCATQLNQRDYFICNPITKHWVALPPTPRLYRLVKVAFVCDPYYYDGAEEQEQDISSSVSRPRRGTQVINANYVWKVVRLVPKDQNIENDEFNVEIFSSEIREWREFIVLHSLRVMSMDNTNVAYKGKLYWYATTGIIFELDLDDHTYNNNDNAKNIAKCRFIKLPNGADVGGFPHLVVTRGRLRLYMIVLTFGERGNSLRAWELKKVVKDNGAGKFNFIWIVDKVPLSVQDENLSFYGGLTENQIKFQVVDLHQHNEDVMYFQWWPYLVTCNISVSGRLEIVTNIPLVHCSESYKFMFPWWPTLVHM